MPLPENTQEDIVDGGPISIVGKVDKVQEFDDGNERYHLTDIQGSRTTLKIWSAETGQYEIEPDGWYLFEKAEGDIYQGEKKLSSNRGDMVVTPLEGVPGVVDEEAVETTDIEELSDGGVVAFDIETISTVPESELNLDKSNHLELLCIGVGYAPRPGQPGTSDVLVRGGRSAEAEADLIERFCEYVDAADPEHLLLFKGDFDLKHVPGRAEQVGSQDLNQRLRNILDEPEVINLTPPGSLEDNIDEPVETHWDIYDHSLNPEEWRVNHPRYTSDPEDPRVTNKDIPYFGERYLELVEGEVESTEVRALRELIRHYTLADIDPLFEMVADES
jgi:hypothetical protein